MNRSQEIFAQELYHQLLVQDSHLKSLHERMNALTLLESIALRKGWATTLNDFYGRFRSNFETKSNYNGNSLNETEVYSIKEAARSVVDDAKTYFSEQYRIEFMKHKLRVDNLNRRLAPRQRALS